jgi:phosphoglycerol transferase MdoB-like AlkP superfamily enzyme
VLNYKNHVFLLFKRLGLALLVYFISRLLFFAFNHSFFRQVGLKELFFICLSGLRFDISAICILNALFILLSLLPATILGSRRWQLMLKLVFLISNALGIIANSVDLAFYRFTLKRLSWDVFSLTEHKSDFLNLLPSFLINYWYVFIAAGLLIALLAFLYDRFSRGVKDMPVIYVSPQGWIMNFMAFLLLLGCWVLGIRGGLQLIPIGIADAGEYTSVANIPLVINSTFSLLKTSTLQEIRPSHYFSSAERKLIYNPIQPGTKGPFQKKNVVIVILESFSKEYTGIGHRISCTPFLDSLMKESYVFDHAFANGKRSAEGIPAILAGVPTLMDEPYNSSLYASNEVSSLPALLKPYGYSSAFFHGGSNGTMNFLSFAHIAGFDAYYGRTEYNNEADFDGHWGIWDEPFLHYFGQKLGTMKQPFIASVFTLSSHDPYLIPEKYKARFPKDEHEILASVRYSDFALQQLFREIKNTPWFENTLFVFTPDHTGVSYDPFYANNVGQYEIPVFFYAADKKMKGTNPVTIQQTDILPTLLDMLGYDKPFFSFGNNALDSSQAHFAVNYTGGIFQLYEGDYFLQFDGKRTTGFYNIKNDSLLQNNLRAQKLLPREKMEKLIKAVLQSYQESLVTNRMTLNKLQ